MSPDSRGSQFENRRRASLPDRVVLCARGVPVHLRSDNGSEFANEQIRTRLSELGVKILFIEPGRPWDNGYNLVSRDHARRWQFVWAPTIRRLCQYYDGKRVSWQYRQRAFQDCFGRLDRSSATPMAVRTKSKDMNPATLTGSWVNSNSNRLFAPEIGGDLPPVFGVPLEQRVGVVVGAQPLLGAGD